MFLKGGKFSENVFFAVLSQNKLSVKKKSHIKANGIFVKSLCKADQQGLIQLINLLMKLVVYFCKNVQLILIKIGNVYKIFNK